MHSELRSLMLNTELPSMTARANEHSGVDFDIDYLDPLEDGDTSH